MARKASKRKVSTPNASKHNHKRGPLSDAALDKQTRFEAADSDSQSFPIVGIGASAGGLEAFSELLQALPPDTGMGFVFVQHLDPKHVSLLTQLLQRQTLMPVQDATDGAKIEPNHVYVIPRDMDITLERGILRLAPRRGPGAPHMPIDRFLRSLAVDQTNKAIGVILSGNASDGALGTMAIKAQGGITFAQSGASAKFDGMPRSATASGCVDFVLAPAQIAEELAKLGRHPYIAPGLRETEIEGPLGAAEAIGRILERLRTVTGVDFTYYKINTLRRRILRRLALLHLNSLDSYIERLTSDLGEVRALYEDVLITVTEFFRDPEAFEALKNIVFPKIVPATDSPRPIRIWVPGCSSGEEVYSIAMLLLEFLEERGNETLIQIFGTDISDVALEKARRGVYPASLVEEISKERLQRFFTRVDSNYVISKRIREMCVFAKQNVISDPPFSRIDLLSCRNVLIYLGPILQNRLISIFHYALRPNGFLLLGTAEAIRSPLFSTEDSKYKIYMRQPAPERVRFGPIQRPNVLHKTVRSIQAGLSEIELLREADRMVLEKFAPAGVVVDDKFDIVQFRGQTSPYLEPPSGAPTRNLLATARNGLSRELRKAFEKAGREDKPVRRESVRVGKDSNLFRVNFEVMPFKRAAGRPHHYLVIFEPSRELELNSGKIAARRAQSRREVERELAATKEYLRAAAQQHESSDEELRSLNEEILSGNEELQSTNEELETAKEELQSTNEELNTVNEELQTSNADLARTGSDLLNLLNNVNIPIVVVGNDLRIRKFTGVSQKLLNLIPTDIGRPISHINLNLQINDLEGTLRRVLETLTPITLPVKDLTGRAYSLRIRPYRTEGDKIDGAVIVLVDLDTAEPTADAEPKGQTA